MPKNNPVIPVMLNRKALAHEVGTELNNIYRAHRAGKILPDAVLLNGNPLFRASRVARIRNMLARSAQVLA